MIACATKDGICLLEFADRKMLETELKYLTKSLNGTIVLGYNQYFEVLKVQLEKYFNGGLKEFNIPLLFVGTDFQKTVWNQLLKIEYGSTTTYLAQAVAINKPSAVRAVANANGMNKISIIVPCHRVLGSDGSLIAYGGGVWRKKKLLELESSLYLI